MKQFKYLKYGLSYLLIWCIAISGLSQSGLSLSEAYALARQNYPLLKTINIYAAMEEKENALVDQSRRPTVMVKGEASLQSEAIRIGNDMSPINVDVPIYRAQTYGEFTYNLFDGGVSDIKKQINEINTLIQTQQLEVDLYPLKQQVNQVFSGVRLGSALLEQFTLTEKDIIARREVLESGVAFGIVLESELAKLDVRLLQLENERLQVTSDIRSAYSLLSVIIGKEVSMETNLILPDDLTTAIIKEVNRPELKLFQDQKVALDMQKRMVEVLDKPYINLFGQAGLAYPNNLNFTDISLSPFALGGIKAGYKLFDKKDQTIKKQKLDMQAALIDILEETFRHNLKVQSARYQDDFQLLSDQIERYTRIAELQAEILNKLKAQLDNGIITSTEYLLQSNEELRARQNVRITESKLYQKQLDYITILGTDDI